MSKPWGRFFSNYVCFSKSLKFTTRLKIGSLLLKTIVLQSEILLKHCTKICFNPLCLRLRASPNYWFHCGIVTLCLYFGDLSIFKEFLLSQFLGQCESRNIKARTQWDQINYQVIFYFFNQTVFCWYVYSSWYKYLVKSQIEKIKWEFR